MQRGLAPESVGEEVGLGIAMAIVAALMPCVAANWLQHVGYDTSAVAALWAWPLFVAVLGLMFAFRDIIRFWVVPCATVAGGLLGALLGYILPHFA